MDAHLSTAQKSTYNVFSNEQLNTIDDMARFYGKELTRQSHRNLPRTYFPNGITQEKKKTGSEMQGVLIVLIITLVASEKGPFIDRFGGASIGQNRMNHWLFLMERLIMVEEYLKQSVIDKESVMVFRDWFPHLLFRYKEIIDRQKGNGCKILKFHLCTHMANDIVKWGPPSAYNSASGESSHKMLKKRAKKDSACHRNV
ncbi:MAG: hypothetical protein HC836_47985 [Richelia sp. RM2_1_2]|nr:hypothetical protein [Richelia sp. RM2_1_2]